MKKTNLKELIFQGIIAFLLLLSTIPGYSIIINQHNGNTMIGGNFHSPNPKDSLLVIANFTYEFDSASPFTVNFTDLSAGDINEWIWDFGDSITSNLQNPSHTFIEAGIYNVCLTVIGDSLNGFFNFDTYCEEIVIGQNNSCVANFTYVS